jgi:hypothetical protein
MNPSWQDKKLDAKFLLDSGLLFEINRTTLHLLGISLVVRKSEDGKFFLALKDNRRSPEQTTFNNESFAVGKSKLAKFMDEFGNEQLNRRRNILGWAFQPQPLEKKDA